MYDSLGDAYYANKELKLAKENFKKSLKLNPANEHAKEMLKKKRWIENWKLKIENVHTDGTDPLILDFLITDHWLLTTDHWHWLLIFLSQRLFTSI